MKNSPPIDPSLACPDCSVVNSSGQSRRQFLKTAGASAAAIAGLGGTADQVFGASQPKSETLVKTLFDSLSEEQRAKVVIPWADQLRSNIENNWHILPQRVGAFFTPDQQAMIRDIFLNIHSEEYRDEVWKAYLHDNRGKGLTTPEEIFGSSSVAIFGEPGGGPFEFVLTGRHCTRRCDGNSLAGAAFGGPIFYGHAAESFNEGPDHEGNAYWFQAKRANEAFQMLDGKQREMALAAAGREERGRKTVELKGKAEGLEGIRVGDLSADQQAEVRKILSDLLLPFRKEDREESMKMIEPQFNDLHLAFYKKGDIGNDGVWDVWQVEGPHMVWHFRGAPHVHTWVNIEAPPEKGSPF
ncbi:MAG: DUF3500 domain-containing protein [Verrucomicrobiae bacterium]|nr:DUF3500 domain-containing protein [Verrucomicrobiae bacterium]